MNYRLIILSILLFLVGQCIVWFQVNGPILWPWADKFKWVLALLGVPITWLFMEATKNAVHGFEGDFWPGRFVSFVTGMVIFTILTYVFKGEGINLKTACCLFLASLIIYIQLFWK